MERAAPSPKGRTIPPSAIESASLAFRLINPVSISKLTRKMNSTRPMFATKDKYSKDSDGKIGFARYTFKRSWSQKNAAQYS